MSETTERSYYLVESMYFEKLLRTHFMLTQSTLLFEHLLSHSDRPMFLSARKVCEVLGLDRHQLVGIEHTEHFYRRKLRKTLSRIPQFAVR